MGFEKTGLTGDISRSIQRKSEKEDGLCVGFSLGFHDERKERTYEEMSSTKRERSLFKGALVGAKFLTLHS